MNEKIEKALEIMNRWFDEYNPHAIDHEANGIITSAVEERDALKAEVERLRSEVTKPATSGDRESRSADEWATKFMKAEAELATARPLLEAAMRVHDDAGYAVITAATAYYKAKGAKP